MYRPTEIGQDFSEEDFRMFVFDQLQAISQSFWEMRPQVYTAEPDKPYDGLIVVADGTQWNPGSGAGYYGYYSGSWRFLG